MTAVTLICSFVVRTGVEGQLRALLQDMLAPTRSEPGCKVYDFYDSDCRGRLFLYETSETHAALEEHMSTPHFKRLEKTGGRQVKEPFEINFINQVLTGAVEL